MTPDKNNNLKNTFQPLAGTGSKMALTTAEKKALVKGRKAFLKPGGGADRLIKMIEDERRHYLRRRSVKA